MAWDDIIGQGRVKGLLRSMLNRRQVAHAYLFYGRSGIGKQAIALEYAKTLQCHQQRDEACGECPSCVKATALRHPDIRIIVPLPAGPNEQAGNNPFATLPDDVLSGYHEQISAVADDPYHEMTVPRGKFIKVNSIREIRRESSLSPVEGRFKIFVILGADRMNAESANALLKTLEEPLPNAILLLTSSFRQRLLPTIVSRCQQVECSPLRPEDIASALQSRDGLDEDSAALAASVSDGSYGEARSVFDENVRALRESAIQFVRLSLGPSHMALLEVIDTVTAEFEKSAAEKWLSLLESWLRDAFIAQQGGSLTLSGDSEIRNRFLGNFPRARLNEAIESVETAIADTRGNVYFPLILTSLAYQLRSSISTPRTA